MKIRLLTFAALLASGFGVSGCLVATESVVPDTSRKPYLGLEFEYVIDNRVVTVYTWSPQKKAYVDRAGLIHSIARARDALPSSWRDGEYLESEDPVTGTYLVQHSWGNAAGVVSILDVRKATVGSRSSYDGDRRSLDPDRFLTHYLRHHCVAPGLEPKACIERAFDPASANGVAVLISDPGADKKLQPLTANQAWDMVKQGPKSLTKATWIGAAKGKWHEVLAKATEDAERPSVAELISSMPMKSSGFTLRITKQRK